jgi:hypothetical protein
LLLTVTVMADATIAMRFLFQCKAAGTGSQTPDQRAVCVKMGKFRDANRTPAKTGLAPSRFVVP